MNGKIRTALLAAGLSLCTNAGASAADLEAVYYSQTDRNVIMEYYDDAGVNEPGSYDQKEYDAILAIKETDLDLDGKKELLVIDISEDEDLETTVLTASAYELEGSKLKRSAQYVIAEDVLHSDTVSCDVFLVNDRKNVYVCCEDKEEYQLISDDAKWKFKMISYDGSDFQIRAEKSLTGDDWKKKDLSEVYKALNTAALRPSDLVHVSLVDQLEGKVEKLCSVKRYLTKDFDEIWDHISIGDGQNFIYGQTAFYNYVNEGYENKITASFGELEEDGAVEILEYEETEDTEHLADTQDYILPDSNKRYLSADELEGLSAYELRIARNEIYARHGREFHDDALQQYFDSKSWYTRRVPAEDFTYEYAAMVMNEYEFSNIALIQEFEEKRKEE